MMDKAKYFVFNKASDYIRGSGENIEILPSGIRIKDAGKTRGIFFSRLLDSREKGMKWHRLLVERYSLSEACVKFLFYSSESRMIEWEGASYDIGELLADSKINIEIKNKLFMPFIAGTFEDPQDALLFNIEGRYLWFQVVLSAQGNISPEIYKIKIYFPKNTWMEYLPEVYQLDKKSASFVERYLGIFQSLYQDMTSEINHVAKYFDPASVDEEYLRYLAGWISIDNSYAWTQEKLRYLVENAMNLYSIRGTVEYIERMVELYTGKKPYIVEYHQTEPFRTGSNYADLISDLYGDNKYIFTIIIDMGTVVSNKEYKTLTKIIENAKPAHMECKVVVLEPFIFLDQYSYMGINSALGQYHDFVLDGQAAVSFTKIS